MEGSANPKTRWSWNAPFADLDNDEWRDLLMRNNSDAGHSIAFQLQDEAGSYISFDEPLAHFG